MAGFPYYLTGGAADRPNSLNFAPAFQQAMLQLYAAAPPEIQRQLGITSGYRDYATQEKLFNASDRSGHSVARPGHSRHEHGDAADLANFGLGGGNVNAGARDWVHANAERFGLRFPMSWEPWHIQLANGQHSGPANSMATQGLGATMAGALDPRLAVMARATNSPLKSFTDDVAQRRGGSAVGDRSAGALSEDPGSDPGVPPVETSVASIPTNEIAAPTGPNLPSAQLGQITSFLANMFKLPEIGQAANKKLNTEGQAAPANTGFA